jgi:iron complex transport system ATP-binding protein
MTREPNAVDVNDVRFFFGRNEILSGISLSIRKNERWAVIGPNGAGKSTLIKVIAGLLRPVNGTVLIEGTDLRKYNPRKRALAMAYVPQKPDGTIPYTVYDFIMLGRYASMGLFGQPSDEDRRMIEIASGICDVQHLMMRTMNTLSGGELQRVLLAGAVAQNSSILLLDEPTTFLDPAHERLFFDALERLHGNKQLTTIMVTHDINNAIYQCSHIAALRNGELAFAGVTEEFRSKCPEVLEDVFGIPFKQFACNQQTESVFGAWGVACH